MLRMTNDHYRAIFYSAFLCVGGCYKVTKMYAEYGREISTKILCSMD
jgi:hypothetical protein